MLAKPELDAIGQCLLRAAEYIEIHGWAQYIDRTYDGRVCIIGAISQTRDKQQGISVDEIAKYVRSQLNNSIVHYNDKPERTKEEVIDKLKEMAYSRLVSAV